MPPEQQWDGALIKGMVGTPARPNPFKNSVSIPVVINFDRKDQDDEPEGMKPARKEDKPRD
eukprot:3514243-Lingulodinium_polyedra.AAC.1